MACPYTEQSPAARGADCPQCVEEGADPIKQVFSRGWCRPHYDRWRNHGDVRIGTVFVSREGFCNVCLEDGEKAPGEVKASGMCSRHYQAQRSHGDPRASKEKRNKGRECSLEGCENPAYLKGYCEKPHYFNYRRTGDPLLVAEKKPRSPGPGSVARPKDFCHACLTEPDTELSWCRKVACAGSMLTESIVGDTLSLELLRNYPVWQ